MILGEEVKPPLDELVHFGVKGMRWGHRKEQELSIETRTIEKGRKLQTVTAGGSASGKFERRVFVSHTVKDNLAYRSTYARTLKFMSDDAATFTNSMVTTRPLKVASEKAAFDTFKKLYDADRPGMIKALAESHEQMTRTMFMLGDVKDQKVVDINVKKYSKKGEDWVKNQGYGLFITGAGTDMINRKLADSYYGSLVKQGFDAIVDQTDVKAKLADDPIVVLKPRNSIKIKNTVPLTESDIDLAAKLYKEEKKRLKNEGR